MKRMTLRIPVELVLTTFVVSLVSAAAFAADVAKQHPQKESASTADVVDGAELFVREWIPGDSRSHGGDGLGPLFNDSSCVACHNQGGTGGAGPRSKNVDIITAFELPVRIPDAERPRSTLVSQVITSIFGELDARVPATPDASAQKAREEQFAAMKQRNREQLVAVHPGFSQGNSLVLHSGATFAGYRAWRTQMASGQIQAAVTNQFELFTSASVDADKPRQRTFRPNRQRFVVNQRQFSNTMQTRFGNFTITRSQRNATALFGAGLIDRVQRETLEALAAKQQQDGEVSGRVAVLKDNKIGRFGWKGQTASLRDFVLTACAVEVGLNVPSHPQSGLPQSPEYRPAGLDLNAEQCDALVDYVSSLPAPGQRKLSTESDEQYVGGGAKLFASIGCAKCHVENVGEVAGIYSDLLLHDMGDVLGDSGGSYGVFLPDSTPDGQVLPGFAGATQANEVVGATRKEWRTPALWGVRDSAPYLHDGRADDIVQAIEVHGGEAEKSAQAFLQLSDAQQFQVVTFLKSLVSPSADIPLKQVASKN